MMEMQMARNASNGGSIEVERLVETEINSSNDDFDDVLDGTLSDVEIEHVDNNERGHNTSDLNYEEDDEDSVHDEFSEFEYTLSDDDVLFDLNVDKDEEWSRLNNVTKQDKEFMGFCPFFMSVILNGEFVMGFGVGQTALSDVEIEHVDNNERGHNTSDLNYEEDDEDSVYDEFSEFEYTLSDDDVLFDLNVDKDEEWSRLNSVTKQDKVIVPKNVPDLVVGFSYDDYNSADGFESLDESFDEAGKTQQCEQQTNNSQQNSISSNINLALLGFMQASSPEVRRNAIVRGSALVRGFVTVRGPTPLRGLALIRGSVSTSVRNLAPTLFRGPSPTQFIAPAAWLPMRTTQPMPSLRPPIVKRMYIVNGLCQWGPKSNQP
ncbi:hypothetical protein TEA_017856 [Camellia sinensis var. sinensis]|uniref:Uncharacterized protein n=1 Tax=Camellia sinensis var. sinensis TaxID=542762 RepID=A0A4S4DZD3_CAMSN|nr:hypothetical protein TEA_017856 [Camellia sinensis var. sinensis]